VHMADGQLRGACPLKSGEPRKRDRQALPPIVVMVRRTAAVALLFVMTACSQGDDTAAASEERVAQAEFGDDWPLTVSEGTLRCEASKVTFEADGTVYAVNGTARADDSYSDIDSIWADDPSGLGLKKNIGPLIDRGLLLCNAGATPATNPFRSYSTNITHCGIGHPDRPTATLFFALVTLTNSGSVSEGYVLWIAMKDGAGQVLYYQNPRVSNVRPGATETWEAPARIGTSPVSCEVACVDDIDDGRTEPRVDRCPGYRLRGR
jgi:hypothetical protein